MSKYPMIGCSQCGQSFGPGDSGYSHCKDHARMTSPQHLQRVAEASRAAQARVKAQTHAMDPRPQNCGTSYCSCIECPYRTTRVQDASPCRAQVGRGNTDEETS